MRQQRTTENVPASAGSPTDKTRWFDSSPQLLSFQFSQRYRERFKSCDNYLRCSPRHPRGYFERIVTDRTSFNPLICIRKLFLFMLWGSAMYAAAHVRTKFHNFANTERTPINT